MTGYPNREDAEARAATLKNATVARLDNGNYAVISLNKHYTGKFVLAFGPGEWTWLPRAIIP